MSVKVGLIFAWKGAGGGEEFARKEAPPGTERRSSWRGKGEATWQGGEGGFEPRKECPRRGHDAGRPGG